MVRALVITHGGIGQELVRVAELILGPQEGLAAATNTNRSAADLVRLVKDWLDECVASGLTDVRIIHGKGIGVLRTIVYSILDKHPDVESYGHPSDTGSWGATVVRLKYKSE